jgi:nicotinate phosphoribosyltransferase
VTHWLVSASNDINEEALIKFKEVGHDIDIFGIGTNLVTCQKQPALGLVYKLVECKHQPTMKLSEDADKSTLPGQKQIYRLWFQETVLDLITSLDEPVELGQTLRAVDRRNPS